MDHFRHFWWFFVHSKCHIFIFHILTYVLYPIHSVWKSPKMSHLNFSIFAFSTNFCPFKSDLSGITVWPQASDFQKVAKIDHFGISIELLSTQNVNVARFARNVKWDLFCDFRTLCDTFLFLGWICRWVNWLELLFHFLVSPNEHSRSLRIQMCKESKWGLFYYPMDSKRMGMSDKDQLWELLLRGQNQERTQIRLD